MCQNDIPLYVNTTFCLPIHLFMDIWFASSFWLFWIMSIQISVQVPGFLIPLGIYLEIELLDRIIILCLFRKKPYFFQSDCPSCIAMTNEKGSNFSMFLPLLFISWCLANSHSNRCEVLAHCGFLSIIYVFLVAVSLCCCAWAFSRCSEWGLTSLRRAGFSVQSTDPGCVGFSGCRTWLSGCGLWA